MSTAAQQRQIRAAAGRAGTAPIAVALWLLGCCLMILAMVVIGGITRLTGSTKRNGIAPLTAVADEADDRTSHVCAFLVRCCSQQRDGCSDSPSATRGSA